MPTDLDALGRMTSRRALVNAIEKRREAFHVLRYGNLPEEGTSTTRWSALEEVRREIAETIGEME